MTTQDTTPNRRTDPAGTTLGHGHGHLRVIHEHDYGTGDRCVVCSQPRPQEPTS